MTRSWNVQDTHVSSRSTELRLMLLMERFSRVFPEDWTRAPMVPRSPEARRDILESPKDVMCAELSAHGRKEGS